MNENLLIFNNIAFVRKWFYADVMTSVLFVIYYKKLTVSCDVIKGVFYIIKFVI